MSRNADLPVLFLSGEEASNGHARRTEIRLAIDSARTTLAPVRAGLAPLPCGFPTADGWQGYVDGDEADYGLLVQVQLGWAAPGDGSEKMPVVKVRVLVAAVLAAAALTACDVQDDELVVIGADDSVAADPTYDAEAEANEAVLSLVPADAVDLAVTDFDQIRLQLGVPDLTGSDPKRLRDAFWRDAETEAPLLLGGHAA